MLKLVGCICASASNWCASSWVVITCQLANVEMMRLTSTWVRWASSLPCSLRLSTFGYSHFHAGTLEPCRPMLQHPYVFHFSHLLPPDRIASLRNFSVNFASTL